MASNHSLIRNSPCGLCKSILVKFSEAGLVCRTCGTVQTSASHVTLTQRTRSDDSSGSSSMDCETWSPNITSPTSPLILLRPAQSRPLPRSEAALLPWIDGSGDFAVGGGGGGGDGSIVCDSEYAALLRAEVAAGRVAPVGFRITGGTGSCETMTNGIFIPTAERQNDQTVFVRIGSDGTICCWRGE
jgi:hypothetical protein